MESFYFTVFGLVFCILLMIIYFPKKKVNSLENKIYSIIIGVTFLSCAIEVYSFFLVNTGCSPDSFKYLLSLKLLFSCFLAWVYFFTLYILIVTLNNSTTEEKMNKLTKNSLTLFVVILAIILLLPININNVGGMFLPSGPSVSVLYACAALCIILMISIFIKNIKNFKSKKYVPLYLLIFMFGVVVAVQNIFPTLLLINAAFVFITFVMYFTIENPDVKMIEELNKNRLLVNQTMEEKSNFLFLASNQIKSPINSILELSNKSLEENDQTKIQENLVQINNLSHSLAFLVENVMDMSTLSIQNIKVVNSKYNLKNLITKIKLVKEKEVKENIDFRVNISENVPEYLHGDSKLLEQVIMSTLDNAIKYTKNGFIELNINTIVKYDMCRLMITIEDSGQGISIDKVNELLMIDEELNESDLKRLETKNVNINTIKKIVSKMGGYFTIKSEENHGTEIKIVIDQKIVTTKKIELDNYSKTENILVASNDTEYLKSITKLLEKKGYHVENSIYANDVIDRIRLKESFNYIILDDMLDIRAIEVLKTLKNDNKFKTPVIVMLDKDVEFIKDHFVEDGFSDYLLKDNLSEEINRIFK